MGREQAGRPSNSQLNFPLGQRCLPLCEPFFCIICGSLDSPYPPLWFFLQLPNRYLEPSPDRSGTFFEDFSSFNSISLCTSKQEEGTWLTPLHLIPLVTLKVLQRFFENNNAHLSPWRKLALLWFLFQSHFICIQGLKISTWTLGLILKYIWCHFSELGKQQGDEKLVLCPTSGNTSQVHIFYFALPSSYFWLWILSGLGLRANIVVFNTGRPYHQELPFLLFL